MWGEKSAPGVGPRPPGESGMGPESERQSGEASRAKPASGAQNKGGEARTSLLTLSR